MTTPIATAQNGAERVSNATRWQALMMEYEMLDSYGIHNHQRIWMSGLVLITLTMLGIVFLGAGVSGRTPELNIITFIAGVAILLTIFWWVLVRRMLGYMRVSEYRKREIEQELGLRMELYLGFARHGRRGQHAREVAADLAEGEPELQQDFSAFLGSSAGKSMLPGLPSEGIVWNLIPLLFIGAWIALWFIVQQ